MLFRSSEIMSQLLTMYVDGVKEPYAVLMNITLQTANVVDYLIKSGLSAEEITLFLSQPSIKKYLTEQKINESLFNKNRMVPYTDMFGRVKGYMTAEKRKDDLIRDLFGELPEYPEDFKITKKNLVEGFTNNDKRAEPIRDVSLRIKFPLASSVIAWVKVMALPAVPDAALCHWCCPVPVCV